MPIRNYVFNERFTPTNFNTYSLNNGLKHIANQNMGGPTSAGVELYNCFTSEFDAYRIVVNDIFSYATNFENVVMQMATGGTTPYTGGNYYGAGTGVQYGSTTSLVVGESAATSWFITKVYGTSFRTASCVIDLCGLVSPRRPEVTVMASDTAVSTSGGTTWLKTGLLYNQATYTGFRLYSPSASISAQCQVYGYRKA